MLHCLLGGLLNKSPQAKVIVMSGKWNFLPDARDLGATETIWKPIDTDTLLDIIQKVLDKS
jgi:DNA-binding NtrC family response regulator